MRTSDYFYELPPELVAQVPPARRDGSRLMVLDRPQGRTEHRQFVDFSQYLQAGDVLVLNNSKVLAARLRGINARSGGRFEVLLLEEKGTNEWWVLLRPGKRAPVGAQIRMFDLSANETSIYATVAEVNKEGQRRLLFTGTPDIKTELDRMGEIPLPPYIERQQPNVSGEDRLRYQTIYAQPVGSVAAPTAGLHFSPEIVQKLTESGVHLCYVTLHVGLGTFSPVKVDTLEEHVMHEERIELGPETVEAIGRAKAQGRRIFAAGTTSVRVLESVAALNGGVVRSFQGKTRIFIHPPYEFKVVDALLTNFHLPCSTLLMLVSAFAAPGTLAGRERILQAYGEAIQQRYRFFSYGDAMLIL